MSSYNNIEKIKYASEDCVVTLREYIVFENERAEEKYVVFKFSNNVSQQLLGMEFEVSQYDIDNNLVEKSVVIYNKFLAKPDQPFVPKAKLKVNYACKTLSVRLIQAAFDRFLWKEGEFLDNSYKFEHYARDEDAEAAKRAIPVKAVKVKEPKPAPAPKRRKGQLPFKAKNAMRKNIAKFPAVFNFLVCLAAIVCIGLAVYFFTATSTAFTLDNFDLVIEDSNLKTVTVTGYDGDEKELIIPAKIGDYTVTRIGEKAFKNSDIEKVGFASPELYIESCAFEGCSSLTTVASESTAVVLGDAFKDCTNLTTVVLPESTLMISSLNNCVSVSYLAYGKTTAENLSELFGGNPPETPPVIITDGNIPSDGGDGGSFNYDPDKTYAYGELYGKGVDGYVQYKEYEAVNGIIETINPEFTDSLYISSEIKGISEKVFSGLAEFTYLTVDCDSLLTVEVAEAFSGVTTLSIANHDADGVVNLRYFSSLSYLSVPCYKEASVRYLYSLPDELESLELKPTENCKYLPNSAFELLNVAQITVAEGFTECGTAILSYNSSVYKITLPKGMVYGDGTIGYGCYNLNEVDIYLENFDTRYEDINNSYSTTSKLIIRTEAINAYGYLNNCYYYLSNLEIHAVTTSETLLDFVCGGYAYMGFPYVYLDIKEEADGFRDGYPSDFIVY